MSESGDLETDDKINVKYSLEGGASYSSAVSRTGNFSDDATVTRSINPLLMVHPLALKLRDKRMPPANTSVSILCSCKPIRLMVQT